MKRNLYVSIVLVLFSIFIVVATGSAVCVNPPSNLVSWWPGDGNAFDIIGPNDGTLMNGATFAPGKVGQAFSFDGVDDKVDASGTNVDDLQQLTIDAWVMHNSLPSGQIQRYVTLGNKAVLRFDGENGPQQLHFSMTIDGVLEHIRVNNVLQVGVFHHVAGTYDGSVMRLYLDGAEVGSLVVSGTVEVGAGVVFSSADEPLDGLLDEVEIYNCDLSASQIEAIYDAATDDHGDDPGAATPISTDGTLYDGEIETSGDVDYFSFSAASGYTYVIETSDLGPGCDTDIQLYDTDGWTVLAWDDDGGTGLASKIEWAVSSSGDYYVEVEHFSSTGTGTYKISVTESLTPPPPPKARICELCSTDSDCESGNCGIGPSDSRCIPAGATSHTCRVSSEGCFIATAAYGSQMEPHVKVLQEFQDRFLLKK